MDNMDLVQILDMAYQKLTKEISSAYYNGRIDEVLKKYELEEKTAGYFHYNYSNSKIIVIGPSFIKETSISAPKIPVSTGSKRFNFSLNKSYSLEAFPHLKLLYN